MLKCRLSAVLMLAIGVVVTVSIRAEPNTVTVNAISHHECLVLESKLRIFSAVTNGNQIVATAERGWLVVYDNIGRPQWCVNVTASADITLTDIMSLGGGEAIVVGHLGYAARLTLGNATDQNNEFNVHVLRLADTGAATNKFFKLASAGEAGTLVVGSFGVIQSWTDRYAPRAPVSFSDADDFAPHLFGVAALPSGDMLVVGEQGAILLFDVTRGGVTESRRTPYGGSLFGVEVTADGAVAYGIDGQIVLIADGLSELQEVDHDLGQISFYASKMLPDGRVVIGGERGGIVLLNNNGGIISCRSEQRVSIVAFVNLIDNRLLAFTSGGRYSLRFDSDAACPKWSHEASR